MTNAPKVLSNDGDQASKTGKGHQNELNSPEIHNNIIDAFDKIQYDAETLDFPGLDRNMVYRDVFEHFWLKNTSDSGRYMFRNENKIRDLEEKIKKGEINIKEEIKNAENTDNDVYYLCISPYTSSDVLNMIFDKAFDSHGNILGHVLYALVINPNLDPKRIEKYLEPYNTNGLPYLRASYSQCFDDMLYSRPDLTPESIIKIFSYGCNFDDIKILIHNKNMPEDLKRKILSDKNMLHDLRTDSQFPEPEENYLGWNRKDFARLDKIYSVNSPD